MNNKKSVFLEYTYYCLFIKAIVGICSFNLKYCFYTLIILLYGFVYISATFIKRAKDKIIYDKTEMEVVAFLQKKDINFTKEDFYIFVKNIVYAYNEALMGENLYNIKKITSSQLSHSILTVVENDRRSSIIRIITDTRICRSVS